MGKLSLLASGTVQTIKEKTDTQCRPHISGFAKGVSGTVSPRFSSENQTEENGEKKKTEENGKNGKIGTRKKKKNIQKGKVWKRKKRKKTEKTEESRRNRKNRKRHLSGDAFCEIPNILEAPNRVPNKRVPKCEFFNRDEGGRLNQGPGPWYSHGQSCAPQDHGNNGQSCAPQDHGNTIGDLHKGSAEGGFPDFF